ncbi:MAG TPA: phosphoethanolamine transferase CptA [Methylotenera sp.]|nr:phosphoethanolamine transferase CptA [Methylotenera sp.]
MVVSEQIHHRNKTDWAGLAWQYLYFWYFSGLLHLIILATGTAGFVGTRASLYMSTLWLVPTMLFPQHARKISAVIGLLLLPFSLMSLGYLYIYHQEFSQSVLFVAFESNLAESSEYLSNYFSWGLLTSLLLYTAGAFYLCWRIRPVTLTTPTKAIFSALIISLIFVTPFVRHVLLKHRTLEDASERLEASMEPATPWQVVIGYVSYQKQLQNMQKILAQTAKIPPLTGLKDDLAGQPSTLVLVIGESTNRQRMSLYGYGRKTTPKLDSMKHELLTFTNVISPRPYTIEVLEQALTFADQTHPDLYLTQPSIMNMMKQAGYKTYWITNQQTMTKRNTMLTTFSKETDEQYYLNNNRSQDARQYDSAVYDPLKQVLSQAAPRKFIIVHLLGTHMNYKYRYPESYAKFTDRQGVPAWVQNGDELDFYNSYDNAVLYNDEVVSNLIHTLSKDQNNSLLLYLSDHGEEVYDNQQTNFKGRSEGRPTASMYTIPFIVWASPLWKNKHPQDLKATLNRPYMSSNLIYTWADLAGLHFDKFDATKSIVNNHFKEYARLIGDPYAKAALTDFDHLISNAPRQQLSINGSSQMGVQ